jgi:D-alanyl-D-alanine carboxypeptidase
MKKKVAILLIIVVAIGSVIFVLNSPEYKLGKIGYSKDEIAVILKNVDSRDIGRYIDYSLKYEAEIDDIILIININADMYEYSSTLVNIAREKYFVRNSLDRYLDYSVKNPDKISLDVVRDVNCGIDHDFYTNVQKADVGKDFLILVNKYYKLNENYMPELVEMDQKYTPGFVWQMEKIAYHSFVRMADEAEKNNLRLTVTSAYRSYTDQQKVYDSYVSTGGLNHAEAYVARKGHSEHHTGLAVDLRVANGGELIWMNKNAHKFGFIPRYTKDNEHLTGYNYEPWHYRYVGKEAALYIYENDITFEEYYAFYVAN